jgi:hypothetical protein
MTCDGTIHRSATLPNIAPARSYSNLLQRSATSVHQFVYRKRATPFSMVGSVHPHPPPSVDTLKPDLHREQTIPADDAQDCYNTFRKCLLVHAAASNCPFPAAPFSERRNHMAPMQSFRYRGLSLKGIVEPVVADIAAIPLTHPTILHENQREAKVLQSVQKNTTRNLDRSNQVIRNIHDNESMKCLLQSAVKCIEAELDVMSTLHQELLAELTIDSTRLHSHLSCVSSTIGQKHRFSPVCTAVR